MNLNNQIEALDQELCKVLQGEGNAVAIKNLDSVYSDLEPSLNVWVQSYKRRQLFSTLPDDFAIQGLSEQELENANASLTAMQAFLDTWQELEKKHEISQNDICSDTRDSLYKLSAEIEAANSRQYKAWLTQISDLIEVSESDLIEQEASPNLKENAFQFRKKLDLFRAESSVNDPNESTLVKLESLSERLIKLKDSMEFDQPEDVVKLFKYLKQPGNHGTAPVSMLTPQVLQWIEEKGEEANFYIGHRRVDRRR